MKLQASCAALAAALATLTFAGAASAQDTQFAFNASVTSDYVFRGASQSDEGLALQGGVDMSVGSFYAGAWASSVDFGDSTDAEIDLYGGYRTEAAGFALDFGVVGYTYVDAPSIPNAGYGFVEFKAAASRAIGPVTAGAAVYYSPDFFGVDDEATYVEGNVAFTPADKWSVSAALGKQFLDFSDDYVTWNVGVGYALTDNLSVDVRYHDTDVDNAPLYDGRVAATLKAAF
ncbi:TorF family putative porin [Brevundimonas staleyi]|uniref:TorF family putative porin n=1 Tax=Brevundimonas staleyi TaxID=74326 RepID=A0ABW0FV58_9CAUL